MRLSFILTLVAVTMPLPFAAGMCYDAGPDNVNHKYANDHINEACEAMVGYYVSEQQRYACVTQGEDPVHWYYNIKRLADNDGTLSMKQCKEGLLPYITECKLGGHGSDSTGDWDFRSDPNNGICKDEEYIDKMKAAGVIKVTKRDVPSSTFYEAGFAEPTVKSELPFLA